MNKKIVKEQIHFVNRARSNSYWLLVMAYFVMGTLLGAQLVAVQLGAQLTTNSVFLLSGIIALLALLAIINVYVRIIPGRTVLEESLR